MTTWGKKRADILYRELFILSICGKWFKKKKLEKNEHSAKNKMTKGRVCLSDEITENSNWRMF